MDDSNKTMETISLLPKTSQQRSQRVRVSKAQTFGDTPVLQSEVAPMFAPFLGISHEINHIRDKGADV